MPYPLDVIHINKMLLIKSAMWYPDATTVCYQAVEGTMKAFVKYNLLMRGAKR